MDGWMTLHDSARIVESVACMHAAGKQTRQKALHGGRANRLGVKSLLPPRANLLPLPRELGRNHHDLEFSRPRTGRARSGRASPHSAARLFAASSSGRISPAARFHGRAATTSSPRPRRPCPSDRASRAARAPGLHAGAPSCPRAPCLREVTTSTIPLPPGSAMGALHITWAPPRGPRPNLSFTPFTVFVRLPSTSVTTTRCGSRCHCHLIC